jgi:mono/diheme cytochrome c family protein
MPGRMTAAGMIICLLSDPVKAAETGGVLYLRHCASCHGANLEGQPDWRRAKSDGTYPAPPHDADGHTWHHDDAMLRDYVTRGGQAVLDDMGVSFKSAMPGFGEVLSPTEIDAILGFIMSRWPDRIRQERVDRMLPGL